MDKLDEIISLLKEIKQALGLPTKDWEKNGYVGDIPINADGGNGEWQTYHADKPYLYGADGFTTTNKPA